MKLKMSFEVNVEVDGSSTARAWQQYFNHLEQLITEAIERQLHDNPPPQSEFYTVTVAKTDYLV